MRCSGLEHFVRVERAGFAAVRECSQAVEAVDGEADGAIHLQQRKAETAEKRCATRVGGSVAFFCQVYRYFIM